MNKNLHIVIPTYNRGLYLDACLASIFRNKIPKNVDITVLDNRSSDNSEYICKRYPLTYIKNKHHVNGNLNIYQAYSLYTSGYIWVIGDDEYLFEDSIEKILGQLSNDPSLIIQAEDQHKVFDNLLTFISMNCVFNPHLPLWEHPLLKLSLISSVIVKSNYIDLKLIEENLCDHNWSRYSWLMGIFNGCLTKANCILLPNFVGVRKARADNVKSLVEIQGQFEDQVKFLNWIYTVIIPRNNDELCSLERLHQKLGTSKW